MQESHHAIIILGNSDLCVWNCKQDKKNIMKRRITSLLLWAALMLNSAHADSYSVTVPAQSRFLIAYHFQAQTVSSLFPSPEYGTKLYHWNGSSWTINSFYTQWTSPSTTINPGDAFLYYNPTSSDKGVNITGTPLTSSVTISLYNGSYHIMGFSHKQSAYLESCPDVNNQVRYTIPNFDYPGTVGDKIYRWSPSMDAWTSWYPGYDSGDYNERINPLQNNWVYWSDYTDLVSPYIPTGEGFLLIPAANKSWTHDIP